MPLQNGDIIDVLTHGDSGRRAVRRVTVRNLYEKDTYYGFSGVNMQGGNSQPYRTPKTPCDPNTLPRQSDVIGWIPFDDSQEADE